MHTILCTVGTSSLEKLRMKTLPWLNGKENPLLKDYKTAITDRFFKELDDACMSYNKSRIEGTNHGSLDRFGKHCELLSQPYIRLISGESWRNDSKNYRLLPAEVASTLRIIKKLGYKENEIEIVLLVSDTLQSYVASQVIKAIFTKLGVENCPLKIVDRFQMESMDKFTQEGIPNFINQIKDDVQEDDKTIFNITGGYKNFIPLVTHIASFYRKDMYYVFEEAVESDGECVVKIPKIPTFNSYIGESSLGFIVELIQEIQNIEFEDRIHMNRYIRDEIYGESHVPYREFISEFFDLIDGKIKLTLIGTIYLEMIQNENRGEAFNV
ncbi:TPA: hypothetical protein ACGW3F_003164 [Bacillus paranthracis]